MIQERNFNRRIKVVKATKQSTVTTLDLPCPGGNKFSVYLGYECWLEVSGGACYAVGDQNVWVASISGDPGTCLPNGVNDILINSEPGGAFVYDGDSISVELAEDVPCHCTSEGPICEDSTGFVSYLKLKVKQAIMRRLRKMR